MATMVIIGFSITSVAAPSINFSWTPSNPTDLQNVHFIDESQGDIIAWMWYFGDGNSSIQQNPWHHYADNGTYNVRLVIILENGSILSLTKTINIANVPPHAIIGGARLYNESNITFVSASYDDDGSISSCHWEFGDGNTSNGCIVTHEYGKDGIYVVNLTVYDNDGASNRTNATIMVDTLPPLTLYNVSCEGWCKSDVNVVLNATDNLSGVDYTRYKIDDGDWHIYNKTIVIKSEGIHKIYFYSVDKAGNAENEKNVTVKIDKTKPFTKAEINATYGKKGWITGNAKIKLNATDNLSGVDYTRYKIDDGDWHIYNKTIVIKSEGIHKIYFYSVDKAGNAENEKNVTVKIDKTKPSVELIIPKQGYLYIANRQIMPTLFHRTIIIGKLNATVNAHDDISGIDYVEFILNGQSLWKDYVAPYTAELPQELPASFSNTLKVIAYDNAGNYKESNTITYIKIA